MRTSHTLSAAALAAAFGLGFAGPALAQSSTGNTGGASSATQGQASGSSQQGTSRSASQAHAMSQQQLRQQLSQAGFRDVRILDAAYLVEAKTQNGEPVVMMINPPNVGGTQTSGMGGSSGSGGAASTSGSGTGASPSSSGGSHGSGQTR